MDGSRYGERSRSRDRVDRKYSEQRHKRSRSRSVEHSLHKDRTGRSYRRSRSRSPVKGKRSYSRSPSPGYRNRDYSRDYKRRDDRYSDREFNDRNAKFNGQGRDTQATQNKFKERENLKQDRTTTDDSLKRVRYDENEHQDPNKNNKTSSDAATVVADTSKVVIPTDSKANDSKAVSTVESAPAAASNKRASGSQSPSFDEDELKDIENFLEFELSAEELQQREAERLVAERKKRAEAIASKYSNTNTSTAVSTLPSPSKGRATITSPAGAAEVSLATSSEVVPVPVVSVDQLKVSNDAPKDNEEGDSNLNILDDLPVVPNSVILQGGSGAPAEGVGGRLLTQASITRVMSLENLALEDAALQKLPPSALSVMHTSEAAAVTASVDQEAQLLANEKSALAAEERANKKSFAFDIFSMSPSNLEAHRKQPPARTKHNGVALAASATADEHLQSNWDDGDGYYKARIGEVICDRFQTLGVVGKGVFSTVLKCYDLATGDGTGVVALKMIRNNDTMRKAAEKERSILLTMMQKDPENKRYCVRLLSHMDFRNHVALVFEFQTMNLRETLKKFGKDVGINIGAVRMYGKQLMIALRFLMEIKVVHADIKLDNILCSGDLKQIKLCDFGSAFYEDDVDNVPTPYLVSRFYRAPEIILGFQCKSCVSLFRFMFSNVLLLSDDRAIDLCSVCVCLYELFTGHVMFPGRTNNEMLRLMMAVKGRFPNKVVKAHLRAYEALSLEAHFDQDSRFKQYEADPITGKTVLRLVDITNPTRDLATVLRGSKVSRGAPVID